MTTRKTTTHRKKATPSVKTLTDTQLQAKLAREADALKQSQQELARRKHQEDVADMSPVSDSELLKQIKGFLSDLQASAYEPWEFQSEEMPWLLKLGIRNGIREQTRYNDDFHNDPTDITKQAQKLIALANEAKQSLDQQQEENSRGPQR